MAMLPEIQYTDSVDMHRTDHPDQPRDCEGAVSGVLPIPQPERRKLANMPADILHCVLDCVRTHRWRELTRLNDRVATYAPLVEIRSIGLQTVL